ncbi:transcription antitermination factor NusB [Mesoterricola silvestris]|uniref:MFS transporter n=1 Tax=Mesoterricola silvestris TaxID=2927979 RepID=A0AA48GK22_9BACT|nr:RsmB/NOP family class I SAM-dependent RNA methyltransferase [Mesoterricola silvestris]BDU71189.1 MFS transporter [Mesoterricola silvestris]
MATQSRTLVARTLQVVFGDGDRVPDAWDAGLSSEDAGLANALLGHCLRRWGTLQAHCRPQFRNPARGVPLGTQVALAIGLAQLAWLEGVTDHAAVNEAVDLAGDRDLGFPPHRGLVNAILRRAGQDREALRATLDAMDPALDRTPFAELTLKAALYPRGQGVAREQLWKRLQAPPRPTFRALGPAPATLLPVEGVPGALQLAPGAAFPREWLASGQGMVQDISSQALMAFRWEGAPRTILDACAAPGGKTTALARRYPEAALTALEKHPQRAGRLRENLAARGIQAEVVVEEAGPWMRQAGPAFDLILLDAPCTGSGTLQKHPELTWIGPAIDRPRMRAAQRDLLEAACSRLAPGGLLIYAVCSWLSEEGQDHRDWALAQPGLEPVAAWPAGLGAEEGPTSFFRPDPLTWPGEGFQAFALTRTPEP